jgi:hypothetical protein
VADLAARRATGAGAIEADPERLTALETRRHRPPQAKYSGSVAEVCAAGATAGQPIAPIEEALDRRHREEAAAGAGTAAAPLTAS